MAPFDSDGRASAGVMSHWVMTHRESPDPPRRPEAARDLRMGDMGDPPLAAAWAEWAEWAAWGQWAAQGAWAALAAWAVPTL
eukprot:10732336-Alexandrium_andersonii.AAC.1